jgi:hypothetical protein
MSASREFHKMLTLNDDVRVILIKIAWVHMQTMVYGGLQTSKNSFGDFIYLCP